MRPHPASLFQPTGPDNKSDGVCRAGSFYLAAIRKELGSAKCLPELGKTIPDLALYLIEPFVQLILLV